MKKVFLFLLSMFWIILLSGCDYNQSMPSISKDSKILKIESSASIGGLRMLDVSASYIDNTDTDKRSLSMNWNSDTWNNTDNKPVLLVVVGDEVHEVPSANYDYKKSGTGASLHISHNITYKTTDSEVKFYLCDKSFYNKVTKTLTFNDQNGSTLTPLNGVGKKKLNFIFTASISIENLKAKQAINFSPLGTMLLLDAEIKAGQTKQITVKYDCFDVASEVDLKTGLSKAIGEVSKTYTLQGVSTTGRNIYCLYCIPRETGGSTVSISGLLSYIKTYRIVNLATYSGKVINLYTAGLKDWFVTEWSGSNEINIASLSGTNIVAEYREKGNGEWIPYNVSGTDLNIYGLSPQKIYEVRLFGVSSMDISFNENLKAVTQWGTTKWTSMKKIFAYCENMDVRAKDIPDLSLCTNLEKMFLYCSSLKGNDSFDKWNTVNVTNMKSMFQGATNFNQPIGSWNTAKVTDMSNMFDGASLFNQNISNWDTSNVTDMSTMFFRATSFNNFIGTWNVSKVTNMNNMFNEAKIFNQDISNWNVDNVVYYSDIFKSCTIKNEYKPFRFRQPIATDWFITEWQGGREISIETLLGDNITAEYREKGIGNWKNYQVSLDGSGSGFNITGLDPNKTYELRLLGMNSIEIGIGNIRLVKQWGVTKWKTMKKAFSYCEKMDITATDIPNLSLCTSFENMFGYCSSLKGNDSFNKWNVSSVTNMRKMFYGANVFNQNIGSWNTSHVTDMSNMFDNARSFNQPIVSWNVSNVNNMSAMFFRATNFNQPIGSWNTVNVINMSNMFNEAKNFNQNISSWNVDKVTDRTSIFDNCPITVDCKPPKFR